MRSIRTLNLSILLALLLFGHSSATAQIGQTWAPAQPPSRLVIPSIDVDASITSVGWISTRWGQTWQVPDAGAGWLATSVSPGRSGNAVLIGHHNVHGKVFRDLKDLAVGDTLTVYVDNQAVYYTVTERVIVREVGITKKQRLENARWIGSFADERLTLVTCHPAWTNTHRLIVVAHPIVENEQARSR